MKIRCLYLALLLFLVSPVLADINQQRATNISTVTTSGTVALGCRGLIFIFSSNFVGTVQGTAFTGANDSALQIPVNAGDWLAPVKYTVTAGSIRIVEVR